MANPYTQYYLNQVGGSIPGFTGIRYQRGHGFFGRVFSGIGNFIRNLAPSLAKRALPSAIGFAQDIVEGQNLGQSAKARLLEAGKNVADETLENIKQRFKQKGKGIPYRKRRINTFNYPLFKRKSKKRTKVNIRKKRKKSKRKHKK